MLTPLRLARTSAFQFPEDVDRIVSIFAGRGFQIEPQDAHDAWSSYSNDSSAGWLILWADDERVFNAIIDKFA